MDFSLSVHRPVARSMSRNKGGQGTAARHGRCVGKEAQRGACPGMEHPAFAQEHYQVLKDYVRAHAPTRADVSGRDVTASDVLLRLNAV